jgi:hypothetical protein
MNIISCDKHPKFLKAKSRLQDFDYTKPFKGWHPGIKNLDVISYAAAGDSNLLPLFSWRCDEEAKYPGGNIQHFVAKEVKDGVKIEILNPIYTHTLGHQRELLREIESGAKKFLCESYKLHWIILDSKGKYPQKSEGEDNYAYARKLFKFVCERYASVAKENCKKLGLPFLVAEKILDEETKNFSEAAWKRNREKKKNCIRHDPKIIEYEAMIERYKEAIEKRAQQIDNDFYHEYLDSMEKQKQFYISAGAKSR